MTHLMYLEGFNKLGHSHNELLQLIVSFKQIFSHTYHLWFSTVKQLHKVVILNKVCSEVIQCMTELNSHNMLPYNNQYYLVDNYKLSIYGIVKERHTVSWRQHVPSLQLILSAGRAGDQLVFSLGHVSPSDEPSYNLPASKYYRLQWWCSKL